MEKQILIEDFHELAKRLTLSFIMGCNEDENDIINKSIFENFKIKEKFIKMTNDGRKELEKYLLYTPFTIYDNSHPLDAVKYRFEQSRGEYEREKEAVLNALKFFYCKKKNEEEN